MDMQSSLESGSTSWRWAAGAAGTTMSTRTAGAELVGVGLLAFLESGEAVAQADEEITAERVVAGVDDFRSGCATLHVRALAEDVVGLQAHRHGLASEELVGERGVPHPCACVEVAHAGGGRVVEVCAEHDAYRSVICAVE